MPKPGAGDCIWLKTRDDGESNEPEGHWFVVLFDFEVFNSDTVIVPINSWESERQDPTVKLREGDHPIIVRPSYVNYRMAQVAYWSRIETWLTDGRARMHEQRFSDAMFARIKGGMGQSRLGNPIAKAEYWRRLSREQSG